MFAFYSGIIRNSNGVLDMKLLAVTLCKACRLMMRYTMEEGEKPEWVKCPHCGAEKSVLANSTVVKHT